ncbi:Sodium/hydrogen exchanger family-domain-containing protein [Trametes meyenii]|nr:Sodium/hydrogen exchanger family-domain-containing protein [Trametes meyenii]
METFSSGVIGLTRRAAAPSQAGIFSGDNPSHYNAGDPIRLWVIQAVVIIGFTQLLALVFGRMRQPRVIAEVIGGVILGPSIMGRIPKFTATIFPDASMAGLNLTANVGLVLFLFIVGMEVDMSLVRRNARASAAISLAGLILPLGLGAALGVPIYHTFTDGSHNFGYFVLFVAVAIGITAFPVLCRILTELKLLDTTVGVVVLSAGVGNDVIGWILLALAVALINASSGLTALWVLLAGLAYVLFVCFPVRWAYRWLSRKTGSLEAGNPSAMMMTVTLVLVLISAFYTDIIGIHAIFGGFVAGLVIPHDHGYAISMVEKLEDLVSILLLPIYFALSGLRTNLGLLNNGITWGYVVLICVVAFFSKFLGCSIAAKLSGFNLRESGAIGTLMSCKGLVELIVLNVGLSAGILDTRTFSMFVLHALILTFMTTPLTLLFYPPKHRVHVGSTLTHGGDGAATAEDGHASAMRGDFQGALKTRVSTIVDRFEQLPAVMTFTQLLQPSTLLAPALVSISAPKSEYREKAASESSILPPSADGPHSQNQTQGRRLTLEALRLIELTDRTSAVFKSQSVDALVRSDALLSVLRTFGYLHRVNVSTSLAVVGVDDFPEHVAQHVRETSSQLVVLPWVSPVVPTEDSPASPSAPREPPNHPTGVSMSISTSSPFDALFQQKRDRSTTGGQAQYIRRIFSDVPTDVALFWDRGLGQAVEGNAQHHLFLPFFGGPDDRLALSLVVQLCLNPCVTASVVRVRKSGEEALTPMNSIEAEKAWNLLHSNTVHNPTFPDTVYGAQTTQTRLASDTADDLLWARFTSSGNTVPELSQALSRIIFAEETSNAPLHSVIGLATRSLPATARLLLVAGRARRMAVESHFDELRKLCVEHNASLGTELPKILGEVASAFVAAGSSASMVIVQAATGR